MYIIIYVLAICGCIWRLSTFYCRLSPDGKYIPFVYIDELEMLDRNLKVYTVCMYKIIEFSIFTWCIGKMGKTSFTESQEYNVKNDFSTVYRLPSNLVFVWRGAMGVWITFIQTLTCLVSFSLFGQGFTLIIFPEFLSGVLRRFL